MPLYRVGRAFYRYHIPDPVMFQLDCRVTFQQIGGTVKTGFDQLQKAGAKMIPVSIPYDAKRYFGRLIDGSASIADAADGAWINFQRQDDVSSTAYFYLDRPESGLPPLMDVSDRIAALVLPEGGKAK